MKKSILAFVVAAISISCNNTKESSVKSVEQDAIYQTTSHNSNSESTIKSNEPSNVMLGTWVGEMSEKRLTIVIEEINKTEIAGYNILGSNKRNIRGTFTDGAWDQPCTKAYVATLNEPGDAKGDGVFTIKFVGYEDEEETEMGPECKGNLKGVEAIGEWKMNKSETKKEISLVKQK